MPAETFQNKYNMVFHENANCTVMNDVQFHQPVTIVSGDKTFLNEAQMPLKEVEEKKIDPLRMFLQNKEDYDYVLEWARLCKNPKDIYNSIVLPLKKKGYGLEITTNAPFLKTLLPYLSNLETSKNADSISRALRR